MTSKLRRLSRRLVARLQTPSGRASVYAIAWSVLIQVGVMASGVLSARALGPEDRGYLGLLVLAAVGISQLGQLGLPASVTFEIARHGVTPRKIFRRLRWPLVVQMSILPVLQILALLAFGFAGGDLWAAALISLPVLPAMMVQQYTLAVLQGERAYRRLNIQRTITPLLYPAVLGAAIVAGHDSLAAVTAAWVVSYAVAAVTTTISIRRYLDAPRPDAPEPPTTRQFLRYGLSGTLGTATPSTALRLDQLIVGLAISPTMLGCYTAAMAFVNLPRFIAQNLGLVAFPATAASSARRQRALLLRFTAFSGLIATAIALPIAILADPLVHLFFGEAFATAAPALQILMVGTVPAACRRTLAAGLRGANRPGAGSVAEGLAVALTLPAAAIGVSLGGLNGVAWAVSIASLLSFAYLLVVLLRLRPSDTAARCD